MNDKINYFKKSMANRKLPYNVEITFNELILKPGAKHYQDGGMGLLATILHIGQCGTERCFGLPKRAGFSCLLFVLGTAFANALVIIVATAMLHNFTLKACGKR